MSQSEQATKGPIDKLGAFPRFSADARLSYRLSRPFARARLVSGPDERPVRRPAAMRARRERLADAERDLLAVAVVLVDPRLRAFVSRGRHLSPPLFASASGAVLYALRSDASSFGALPAPFLPGLVY